MNKGFKIEFEVKDFLEGDMQYFKKKVIKLAYTVYNNPYLIGLLKDFLLSFIDNIDFDKRFKRWKKELPDFQLLCGQAVLEDFLQQLYDSYTTIKPYPFIQTGDIARSGTEIRFHSNTLSEFGLGQSKLFPKVTVCITIAANIGDTGILTYDCCFPDSVVGFTPNDLTTSKNINYYLTVIKDDLEHYAPATAQKNINLRILRAVLIPIAPLEEQKEIVRILDNLLSFESEIEELTQLEDQIELLKKSILAKAFRGELGTNDPTEEYAIELLKEVLKEKIK